MLITLAVWLIFVVGIITINIPKKKMSKDLKTTIDTAGVTAILIGIVGIITTSVFILASHTGVANTIELNRIEYESLVKRKEVIDSKYEDVSKSDTIKDIAEWNKKVQDYKYWNNNPWTSWFYNKKIIDKMEFIEFSGD